jgi:hypothetical protein
MWRTTSVIGALPDSGPPSRISSAVRSACSAGSTRLAAGAPADGGGAGGDNGLVEVDVLRTLLQPAPGAA